VTTPTTRSAPGQPAAVTTPSTLARPQVRARKLRVTQVDPWSVAKMSFLLSLAIAIITVVAVLLLWLVLQAGGVFTSLDRAIIDIVGQSSDSITRYFDFGTVFGICLLLAALDVVLVTAIGTVFALLYNLAASFVGGVQVTLSDE
jgi:hypothetical protein